MDKIHFDAVPGLSIEQVEQNFMAELANGNGGVTRRIALAFLARSSAHYYDTEMDEETGEVFLTSVESLNNYIDLMKTHIEMMDTARARMFAVLGYHFENDDKFEVSV